VTDRPIAALFVRADSIYKTMPGVDCYDIDRDARTWPGGCPVVAHPPCRAWGSLRQFAKPRKGERLLATWSVRQGRRWGGVLEHPKASRLWPRAKLPKPGQRDAHGGWTLPIHQNWFGHRATKATLLYIVGIEPRDIPRMPMVLGNGTHVIKRDTRPNRRVRQEKHCTKAEREHTPPAFASWLVDLARRCRVREEIAA
jgi:hypothetical protein